MCVDLKVKLLDERAQVPAYQSAGAAGFDLCALDSVLLRAGKSAMVGTGLAFEIPNGYEMQIRPRSGLAAKHGISVLNTPGTIDSDYRGEVKVILVNHSESDFEIKEGERIAQGVLAAVSLARFMVVGELGESERGERGFGSSGR